jgi:tetratricopeptide (TPR) repeat protein
MAKKDKNKEELLVDVESSLTGLERYFEENKNAITGVAVAIFVVVAGYFAYTNLYQKPLEQEAKEEIFYAERLFQKDSFQQAIEGYQGHLGFLDVAADYSSTAAGNMANYYAGISYLQLGQYENAIRLLDEFSTTDPILSAQAKGAIGDAFMELKQPEEALDYYRKAAKVSSNSYVVPFYLFKAGLVAEMQDDPATAVDFYQRIKQEFPDSKQAADIEKYIAHAEAKQ